ncbi:methyl-accepting chemotaxis protein [Desulfovibrio inopinatus]|uniref:methyl-accepting chemotaxis protein n=1 Tax=Desulfovibrio inopinatus TaxID=102109 RepID=UPI000403F52F|nr:methyl-accepting chemotaxis protein [Desulfovibrio inopinatus]
MFNHLKIGIKIALGFALVLIVLIVVSTIEIVGLDNLHRDVDGVVTRSRIAMNIKEMEINHLDWVLSISRGIISNEITNLNVESDPKECAFGKWFYGDGKRVLEEAVPSTAADLSAIERYHNEIHHTFDILKGYYENNTQEIAHNLASTLYIEKLFPSLIAFRTLLNNIDEKVRSKSFQSEDHLKQDTASKRNLVIMLSILAILVATGAGIVISRRITQPLHRLLESANSIATGDLNIHLPDVNSKDEMGDLARAFFHMAASLNSHAEHLTAIANGDLSNEVIPLSDKDTMGNALSSMVQALRKMTGQMTDAAHVLTTSISQISASSTQLSTSSAETATAVSEISATVEEVKQTTRLSMDKAKTVAEVAAEAAKSSQSGSEATEQLNAEMDTIKGKMEYVAQHIVRLSEKSQDIAHIIAVVNDLADQSNILAVNAAIEAAKAGEEGRGFSVVAQEIRSLAEQSKQATDQVRSILADIQKATSAAVMATEQGSNAVESGVHRTENAATAIQQLADTISQAAMAATQISASSQEEFAGMDQVALAMDNISQATSQNTESARQLENSAMSLQDLGIQLQELVSRYKL